MRTKPLPPSFPKPRMAIPWPILAWPGLTGLGMTLAFPNGNAGYLAWVMLIPLLWIIRDMNAGAAFRAGFVFGLLHYASLLWWIVPTLRTHGGLPLVVAIPPLILLAAYMALYPATFCGLAAFTRPRPLPALAILPGFWAALEFLRANVLTGFPWAMLGHSQHGYLHLIQICDIGGVYAVSSAIVLINAAGGIVLSWRHGEPFLGRAVSRSCAVSAGAAACAVMASLFVYGQWRLSSIGEMAAGARTLRAGLVQGNIEQSVKWHPDYQEASVRKYEGLTLSLADRTPDVVVWPETAAPFYFGHNPSLTDLVRETAKGVNAWLLTGAPAAERSPEGEWRYFNSAFLLSPDGRVAGRYDKVHLVPYGEYVPLRRWMPFLRKLVDQVGDFSTGKPGATLSLMDLRAGALVCYEIIFPELARSATANGAALLLNVTNDAWYGLTSAPWQHLSMSVFRAVENRRSLVRSANTGSSAIIDPAGRILAQTDLFTEAALVVPIPVLTTLTYYTRWGDVFAWICVILSIGASITAARAAKPRSTSR